MEDQLGIADGACGRGTGAWYVFLSKPRQEVYAASKLAEQGYEVFLPMLGSWSQRNGGWLLKEAVMFPRYGFFRPGHGQQALGPARSTPGVSSLVRFGHALGRLSEAKVEALRAVVQARAAAPGKPLDAGQHVVFSSGPLKGLAGIVSSVATERVMVLMSLLGSDHTVATPLRDVSLA